jgi:hypothetical protein
MIYTLQCGEPMVSRLIATKRGGLASHRGTSSMQRQSEACQTMSRGMQWQSGTSQMLVEDERASGQTWSLTARDVGCVSRADFLAVIDQHTFHTRSAAEHIERGMRTGRAGCP